MVRSLSLPKRRLHIVIPGLTGNLLLQNVQVQSLGVFFRINASPLFPAFFQIINLDTTIRKNYIFLT